MKQQPGAPLSATAQFRACEARWSKERSISALRHAIQLSLSEGEAPKWVLLAAESLCKDILLARPIGKRRKGRGGSPASELQENLKHRWRYLYVKAEIEQGHTLEEAVERASALSRAHEKEAGRQPWRGSPKTFERSYQLVKAAVETDVAGNPYLGAIGFGVRVKA